MPFAANGQISTTDFGGAVEISQAQYQAALEGMLSGKIVVVDGGFAVIDPPEPELEPAPPPLTPEEALAAWRGTAKISKAEFILGLILLEILTLDDAIGASRGNWPTALAGFLDYLTPEQSAQVQIEWATRTTIGRMDTYVLVLGSYLSLTDAQLDGIFGRDA